MKPENDLDRAKYEELKRAVGDLHQQLYAHCWIEKEKLERYIKRLQQLGDQMYVEGKRPGE